MTEQTKHDRIFLQAVDDEDFFYPRRGYEDDVEYIRADVVAKQLAEREKQIVMLRKTLIKMESDYNGRSVSPKAFKEALSATQDLSNCIICDAEPVAWSQSNFDYFSIEKDEYHKVPLYKARKV
jgi:hypothetical protein